MPIKDRERRRAYFKEYMKEIRKKARWSKILIEVLGGKCAACGNTEDLQLDHIIPLSEGGPHQRSNVQVLCKECHQRKTGKERMSPVIRRLAYGPPLETEKASPQPQEPKAKGGKLRPMSCAVHVTDTCHIKNGSRSISTTNPHGLMVILNNETNPCS